MSLQRFGAWRFFRQLLAEGAIFEYWSHEASFLPIETYLLYRRMQLEGQSRSWAFVHKWVEENRADVERVMAHVREHGSVMSSDFERTDGQKGTWWNWKAEKMALEMMFTTGDLMIARRKNFQRIYDLRERVRPDWDDANAPSLDQVYRAFALATVRALGVVLPRWQADYFRVKKQNSVPILAELAAEGALIPVAIEGFTEPAYIHPENLALAQLAAFGALVPTYTPLLSSFDPIVWDRRRALELWGFEYRIECYTPAPKRRYGYFTLPILWRGELIGRLIQRRGSGLRSEKVTLPSLPLSPPSAACDHSIARRLCARWQNHSSCAVCIGGTRRGLLRLLALELSPLPDSWC